MDLPAGSQPVEPGDSVFLPRYFSALCGPISCKTDLLGALEIGAILAPQSSVPIGDPGSIACDGVGNTKTRFYPAQAVVKQASDFIIDTFFSDRRDKAEIRSRLSQIADRILFRARDVYHEVVQDEPLMLRAIVSVPAECRQRAIAKRHATQFISGRWFGLPSLLINVQESTALPLVAELKTKFELQFSVTVEASDRPDTSMIVIGQNSPRLFALDIGSLYPLINRHQDILGNTPSP